MTEAEPILAVVGIGASAGGIEALTQLLSTFTSNDSAFVVVMHLSPTHRSELAQVLRASTQLAVVRAEDGLELERNTIYVIPEYFDILLSGPSTLALVPPHEPRPRRTIDHFLRSLARARGANAVGMILSGTGMDGAAGLRAIHECGGTTFAQSPGSATHDEMPRNAFPFADYCGTPLELGALLMRILGPRVASEGKSDKDELLAQR